MNDDELLNKLCYKDLVLSGVDELYKRAKQAHPKITMKIVKEWLSKQQSAQMNNKAVKKIEFKPIYAESSYSFQMDLTLFPRYTKKNDGYYILFTAININTRYGYGMQCSGIGIPQPCFVISYGGSTTVTLTTTQTIPANTTLTFN